MQSNSPIEIRLDPWEFARAKRRADKSYQRYKDHEGHYQDNYYYRHQVGACGEEAVWQWLTGTLDVVFGNYTTGDILYPPSKTSIEVKSWSKSNWDNLGRAIAVDQFPLIHKRDLFVVWCQYFDDPKRPGVLIHGYNRPVDLHFGAQLVEINGVRSYQLSSAQISTDFDYLINCTKAGVYL